MKKKKLAKLICSFVSATLLCGSMSVFAEEASTIPGNPENVPENLEIDWMTRYHYEELEDQISEMAATYPELTELYSIGTSWQERDLWCLEITNEEIPAEEKTGIGVFGPIHGGEREAASSAMYFAWWTLLNSDTEYVQNILDNYIIYVIPSINPDGYEQSFVINTRQNLRPRDLNGDGIMFSDPYNDIDGDGYIAQLYSGTAEMTPSDAYNLPEGMKSFGTESSDWDGNGILGDDPRNSGIDMNRTFDYQWGRYDIETAGTDDQIGGITSTTITGAAMEPEVQAVQNFMQKHEMNALVVLHTGEQSVLYPWCYRAYDETEEKDADLPLMAEIAADMAQAATVTTGRDFYSMSSHEDYPTSAELIDYAFGKFNIHAYTIEVYCAGDGEYSWGNSDTLPEAKWVFYTQDELAEMGVDVENLTNADGDKLAEDEGLWFYTSSTNQMVDKVPEDQDIMVQGIKDAILVMIESEPCGNGYSLPDYMQE